MGEGRAWDLRILAPSARQEQKEHLRGFCAEGKGVEMALKT